MNIRSNEDFFGMEVIVCTAGSSPPHTLFAFSTYDVTLNQNRVTIEQELGVNSRILGQCLHYCFLYWVLILFLLGDFVFSIQVIR
jgi:hypothetical protein